MSRYVALLRGINVGGKNLIKMPALKACLDANGFENVTTYIQSGNVLFGSPETRAPELASRIEASLGEVFGYAATPGVGDSRLEPAGGPRQTPCGGHRVRVRGGGYGPRRQAGDAVVDRRRRSFIR